jgi:pyruvate formate lyase activating enzyme
MREAGIFIEITTLIVPGENDSPSELKSIAEFIAALSPDIPWHVSRFHPDFEMTNVRSTDPGTINGAIKIGREAGLNYIFAGNLPGRGGEDTVCPGCGRTVVERAGFRVLSKNVTPDGRCGFCGRELGLVAS